ncbi:sugar phosphate isomerase/epimerase [Rathayibacter sp. VKM Ac-2760]|uniref:sugar phosphate isomerase/epimerase family protein n=1 Tax=Rathayibacter sp. VKM Ac-2760 TaxID=2609253 RepID=UPI001316AFBF|nr:sugar phosphate isomerase/epimerase [Rathayibacter sp. VKM Ac-2760]QHC60171.1 TIM barrel protein [Rathayibacter sp. VKM Ac-2760]
MRHLHRIALNPIQWAATPDGWVDGSLAPDLDTVLASVADAGYRAVHIESGQAAQGAALLARLERHGLAAGPGIAGNNWTDDPAVRRERLDGVRRVGANYAAIGVEVVFLTANMPPDHPRVEHAAVGHLADPHRLADMVDILGETAEALTAEGVRPALHPHVGSWVETEEETRAVLDGVPAGLLGFGPDIGHLAWAGADPVALVAEYRDRVAGVHLKDYRAAVAADSRRERRSYRAAVTAGLWVEPGRGDADLAALDAMLGEDESIWWVVEVDQPDAPTPQESIRRCGEWLAAGRPPLRSGAA